MLLPFIFSTSQAYGVPSATTANITFRAIAAGTVGNTYLSVVVIGATMSVPGANFTGGTAGSGTAPAAVAPQQLADVHIALDEEARLALEEAAAGAPVGDEDA